MNKYILLFIFMSPPSFAETYDFYKIKSSQPVYILPIVHISYNQSAIDRLKISISKEISDQPKICTETIKNLNHENSNDTLSIIISKENSISKYLDIADYYVIAEYLQIKKEFLDEVYHNYTPFFLYGIFKSKYIPIKQSGSISVDDSFINMGFEKSLLSLQTPSEISKTIENLFNLKSEWKSLLLNLIKLINCVECAIEYSHAESKAMELTFNKPNSEMAKYYSEKMAIIFKDEFIFHAITGIERNIIISERIIDYSKSNKCNIFLVGLAHFGGENGLEKLMGNLEKISISY